MSVSAKLYLNPKWELDDIITVLERTQKQKVKVVSCHQTSAGFFYLIMGKRQISAFVNSDSLPIGIFTELHLGANEEATKIFRDIAQVLGGLLQPEDSKEEYEIIYSKLSADNGMPYFVKYAILHDGVEPDDLKGILKSIGKWYKDMIASNVFSSTKDDTIYKQLRDLDVLKQMFKE